MPYKELTITPSVVPASFHDTLSGGTNYTTQISQKSIVSEESIDDRTQGATAPTGVSYKTAKGKHVTGKRLSMSLLRRAKSIIESFKCDDTYEATINYDSLQGIILELWESARNTTQFHQQILGILESAILSIKTPNQEQLSVFREAIIDLGQDVLAETNVDIIRRQFMTHGFSPLALLSEIEDENCDSRESP